MEGSITDGFFDEMKLPVRADQYGIANHNSPTAIFVGHKTMSTNYCRISHPKIVLALLR
jgi:glycerol dehydrogenase-like iron-containing ADH family enzyme